ncbi:peroxiredoxin family protein [Deinococcus sp. SL84]|uniref:peroxiredoxin family protein n=1 Tax=Deinococcus sp. SL84 TaxID=2994663 RepID=UPI0022756495|nr:TlpA disulfide reductase family protein [Deinococcus sp. SL84]MCY1703049.1 TlpA disulfide reductase family protein [Deinococcus sp. SL84]
MTPESSPPLPWPAAGDFVWRTADVDPARPSLLMFFHLECAGCVSRGIPFMKRLHAEYGEQVNFIAVHTSRGHRQLPRADILPTLLHFAERFARLPFPVALDETGALAAAYATEGTPHWIALEGGEVVRSIYGSQENAQTRLEYWLAELTSAGDA